MEARIIKEHKQQAPVTKADVSVQVTPEDAFNAGDWIIPMNDRIGMKTLVKHSTILPQCIRAYKNNIAGFGIGVRYVDDVEETPEMAAEYSRAEEIIELLNIEQDTKEVFEDIIEARETYGAAYIEVIRDVAGDVVQIEFIKDTPSVYKTKPLEPYIGSMYYHHGKSLSVRNAFANSSRRSEAKRSTSRSLATLELWIGETASTLRRAKRLTCNIIPTRLWSLPLARSHTARCAGYTRRSA